MFLEIILLSVVVITAYLGPMVLRRSPPGQRLYGWLLVSNLAVALMAFFSRRSGEADGTGELLAAVAIGGAVALIVVPPILRDFARRALLADRLRLALLLIDLRELLQPNMGARQERELVEAIVAVRSGQVDAAVEVLKEARGQIEDPLARRQIDERIIMTYLYARQWDGAIEHYEATLHNAPGPVSPQLLVEMVRAYCEYGDLDKAAELVKSLEASMVPDEPLLAFLINRSRLMFLAFVGRTSAVDAIMAPSGPLGMLPEAHRAFWAGIARLNAGDRSGARNSLQQAAKLSGRDKRARELAERTLTEVDEVDGPRPVSPPIAELADQLSTLAEDAEAPAPQPTAPRMVGVSWRQFPVTAALVAVNVAVAVMVFLSFGSTGDMGGLVRAGANVKSAVAVGEWWRLTSSMFLHVGILHLVLNMYGLWILGKLLEQMLGSKRFFGLYMISGIAGALASFYFGGPGTSAGASGAVFGVLGAATAELGLYRSEYPERWRKALFRNLVFLIAANVGIGFLYPAIDQSAHFGGLVTGAVLMALLSQRSPRASSQGVAVLANLLAVVSALSLLFAVYGVASNDFADTLSKYPRVERTLGEFVAKVPSAWKLEDEATLRDKSTAIGFRVIAVETPKGGVDGALTHRLSQEQVPTSKAESIEVRADRLIPLSAPWKSRELRLTVDDFGGEQRGRIVLFARKAPDGPYLWMGSFFIPEVLAPQATVTLNEVLGSLRRRSRGR